MRTRILISVCLVAIAVFAATSQTIPNGVKFEPAATAAQSVDERYRIGYQDVLDVQIFRHPELNQRLPVSPSGTISLFRIDKPIIAVCKTERELADEIAAAYQEKVLRRAEVRVFVAEQKSQSIGIIGAIERPGNYLLDRRIHLLELLARAGGPKKEAGTRMIVVRTGSSFSCKQGPEPNANDAADFGFRIRDVQEGKVNFWMQPGDVVSVLSADIIYVYGNVNKQGALPVQEPITLTQAIVSSEGLKPATKKDRIRVLRQRPGSAEREELVFNLNDIDKGKVKDPILEPNDIVAVSEDKTKSILLGLANSIKATVPNVLYRVP